MSNQRSPTFWVGLTIAAFAVFIALLVVVTSITFVRTDGGHVAVVRNGGPLDNNKIRSVVQPASSRKYEGMLSLKHEYPASQRYYTIAADAGGDRPGVDVFTSSTSDGTTVGLEGTVQFTLNTDEVALKKFDDRFGTRTFPVAGSPNELIHPWEGDKGWSTFLDAVVRRQVLDNALRLEIQSTKCADLVPSCVYVNADLNSLKQGTVNKQANGQLANANLARIQANISKELQTDMDNTLGGHFLIIGRFNIARVTLSPAVQAKIDEANGAKVDVQKQALVADQKVAAANGERRSNEARAAGIKALNAAYRGSPVKGQIDAIHALCGDTGCQNLQVLGASTNLLTQLGKK